MKIIQLGNDNLQETAETASLIIKNGGIVAAPFDTVYGFIADPYNESAVARLNEIKGRGDTKTIGLATFSIDKIEEIADIDNEQTEFVRMRTPGKFTFILKDNRNNKISDFCKRGETVAVRIPDSLLILKIAENAGAFLAQTSANKSGQQNCYSIEEITSQFGGLDQFDLVVDGGVLSASPPSELWDLTGTVPKKIERI